MLSTQFHLYFMEYTWLHIIWLFLLFQMIRYDQGPNYNKPWMSDIDYQMYIISIRQYSSAICMCWNRNRQYFTWYLFPKNDSYGRHRIENHIKHKWKFLSQKPCVICDTIECCDSVACLYTEPGMWRKALAHHKLQC